MERKLKELQDLQQLIEKIEPQRKKVEELNSQAAQPTIKENKSLLQYEACLIDFKPLTRQKNRASRTTFSNQSERPSQKNRPVDQALSELKRSEETFRGRSKRNTPKETSSYNRLKSSTPSFN